MNSENIKIKSKDISIEDNFKLRLIKNNSMSRAILKSGDIAFIFALNRDSKLDFSPIPYELSLESDKYLLLFDPLQNLSFTYQTTTDGQIIELIANASWLHHLFLHDQSSLQFLLGDNAKKKLYKKLDITPQLIIPLNQLLQSEIPVNISELYFKAKALEIISLCFGKSENPDEAKCPFLKDEVNLRKIREVKQILMQSFQSPPTIKELCKQVGINEYNLKSGFKNLYGTPVMHWVNNYRLELANRKLQENTLKINELSDYLGYNSPSHFIDAFKKKYGLTPKKFQQTV